MATYKNIYTGAIVETPDALTQDQMTELGYETYTPPADQYTPTFTGDDDRQVYYPTEPQDSEVSTRYPPLSEIENQENPYDQYYKGLDTDFTDEEYADIQKQEMDRIQAQIDAINAYYNQIIAGEERAGIGRAGQTRSVVSRAGLLGSPRGAAQREKTDAYTREIIRQRKSEQGAAVSALLTKAQDRADDRITAERELAEKNREKYLDYLKEQQGEARQDVQTLAKSGLALSELPAEDYKRLLEQTGYDQLVFDTLYNSYMPKESQINYKIQKLSDDRVLFYGQDPTTGELIEKFYDYSLGEGEEMKVIDGIPYAVSKDQFGNLSMKKIGGFEEKRETQIITTNGIKQLIYSDTGEVIKSFGSTNPSDPNALTKEEKQFLDDAESMNADLSSGDKDWAEAFNFMKARYSDAPDELLDQLLNAAKWRQEGAYEYQLEQRARAESAGEI